MTGLATTSVMVPIRDPSGVGEARRQASHLAIRLGLNETAQGKVSLIVTEAAKNLSRHARDGVIVLRPLDEAMAGKGLEVLALDKGPGILDLARCMADGFSTAGSPGSGLGAMARMSDRFDVHSVPDKGTALMSRVGDLHRPRDFPRVELGAVSVAVTGERECGDAWAVQELPTGLRLLVVDGLGHGPDAARAAAVAVEVFRANRGFDVPRLIAAQHAAMHPTRGAAVAVAEVDFARRLVRYAGIGNIAACVVAPSVSQSLVSHHGIVGHEMRTVREFSYAWPPHAMLVMHSDGLQTRWQLGDYPGLLARHPALAAGTLFRDYARGRDDVTVLTLTETTLG